MHRFLPATPALPFADPSENASPAPERSLAQAAGATNIPFSRPYTSVRAAQAIQEALAARHLAGGGPLGETCERSLQEQTGSCRALLTSSCTAALEMAAMLTEIAPGDEVIMPSFTFSSTATAFVLRGAVPVFVDIRPDTLNLDERLIEAAITPRTRIIVPMHYAGVACAMDDIMDIAIRHRLLVIEDAAQGTGASYRERALGTIGALGALSFHESKNIQCGEGGALLMREPQWSDRAEILREKGTNRARFQRGHVDEYVWEDIGSSFLVSELTAALLQAQLADVAAVTAERQALWQRYLTRLAPHTDGERLVCPTVPAGAAHNGHIFWIALGSATARKSLTQRLRQRGIEARPHYLPLHLSPAGRRFGATRSKLTITETMTPCLLRLPLWNGMDPALVDRVAAEVIAWLREEG